MQKCTAMAVHFEREAVIPVGRLALFQGRVVIMREKNASFAD